MEAYLLHKACIVFMGAGWHTLYKGGAGAVAQAIGI